MRYILEIKEMKSIFVEEEILQIIDDVEMMLEDNGTKHGEITLTLCEGQDYNA
jgi:hypothetical protein